MRNYSDFYNEVLAARFSGDIEIIEKRENILASKDSLVPNQFSINSVAIEESRTFFKRLFSKRKKRETVLDKIRSIKKKTIIEVEREDDQMQNSVEIGHEENSEEMSP